MLFGEELFGSTTGFLCIGLIGDVVAFEHCPGPVARNLHNHTFRDAGSPEVANGCPAKIMEEQVGNPGSFASLIPALTEVLNRPCAPGKEVVAFLRLQIQKLRHVAIYRDGNGLRLSIRLPPFHRDARLGDLFMSLIHTCELNKANPFDYLTELLRHPVEMKASPAEWMPWNYRETLARSTRPVAA